MELSTEFGVIYKECILCEKCYLNVFYVQY